jgi:mRNA interferase MazF
MYPFPFTNLKGTKLRPCLILSNEMRNDILLCQLTSLGIQKDEFTINLGKNETIEGSLHKDSYIRCNMLFTGEKKTIEFKVCSLNNEKYKEVCKRINQIISK